MRIYIIYVALSCLVLNAILNIYINYWSIENEAFPKEDSGVVLCVVLNSSTESNYVEKHFLTFVSNKYFGIVHLKKANYSHFLGLI